MIFFFKNIEQDKASLHFSQYFSFPAPNSLLSIKDANLKTLVHNECVPLDRP